MRIIVTVTDVAEKHAGSREAIYSAVARAFQNQNITDAGYSFYRNSCTVEDSYTLDTLDGE